MVRRILIVPDKFKGTLTAVQAAAAMARGWSAGRPGDLVEQMPMSDGGDGFGAVLGQLLGAERRGVATVDAAHRPLEAEWFWDSKTGTAVIESAGSIGLTLLPAERFHPTTLDTRGLGETLALARNTGARKLVIGLGGSATNDGGFGMVRALGGRFFDSTGAEIQHWLELERLVRWTFPAEDWAACEIVAACDVTNPLLGVEGCSRIYGPQKGLRPEDFPRAEAALTRLAEVTGQQLGRRLDREPGSGAAGGLGFAVRAFLGGRLESGFEIVAALAGLRARVAAVDLVLTGEGGLDRQTLMGKGTGRIAQLCRDFGKPCVGLAGMVEAMPEPSSHPVAPPLFTATFAIVPKLATADRARAEAAHWLETLARSVAADFCWE